MKPTVCLGRRARLLALSALMSIAAGNAAADTPLALHKSFAGNINIGGTQATLLNKANGAKACDLSSSRTADLSLPAFSKVVSAHLYWAGSGSSPDYTVRFEGKDVSAPANRRYYSNTLGGGFNYFGGAADVTGVVAAKGSGSYSFSGLSVATGTPYCGKGNDKHVLAGFALVVVYSHFNEPFRSVNLYEGYQALRNNSVQVDLGNFRVPSGAGDTSTGRLAHLVWEGDVSQSHSGETVAFNGVELTAPPHSVPGNQFNSKSGINSDEHSFAIDFDVYPIKPPAFKAGDDRGTLVLATGEDIVLLNAAALAIPSAPMADLKLDLTRNGVLEVGRTGSYTLKVSNLGPGDDSGPTAVSITLPSQLGYVSASGSGWRCSPSSGKLVCTQDGGPTANGSLPELTVNVSVNDAGKITFAATVEGTYDPDPRNNSASDTFEIARPSAGAYEFTAIACAAGAKVGTDACPIFTGPVVGGTEASVFVTAVSGGAAVVPPSPSAVLKFGLSCVNPARNAGVTARYAGTKLPLCAANGAIPSTSGWSEPVTVNFTGASALHKFRYDDVGRVGLHLRDEQGVTESAQFVVRPRLVDFAGIRRADGVQAPSAVGQPAFAFAGEAFTIEVGAFLDDGKSRAPNFGNEDELPQVVLRTLRAPGYGAAQMPSMPPLEGSFLKPQSGTTSAGLMRGNGFSWREVGELALGVGLDQYLGVGGVTGNERVLGRFYPAYFTTDVGSSFPCLDAMKCPDPAGPVQVQGGAFSGQGFGVKVKAFAAGGTETENYAGVFAPATQLLALDAPGTGKVLTSGAGTGLQNGTLPAAQTSGEPSFLLPVVFDPAAERTTNWSAPTAVYIRAEAAENRLAAGGANAVTVSSRRADPAQSEEGGVMIVAGRLMPGNVSGSPLLKTPVPIEAQYWSGGAWLTTTGLNDEDLIAGASASFTGCRKHLRSSPTAPEPNNCDPTLTGAIGSGFVNGVAKYVLDAPGQGKFGSAFIQLKNGPGWLPSGFGRVVFGSHNSPVIYMREVY